MKPSRLRALTTAATLLLAFAFVASCATEVTDYTDLRGRASEFFPDTKVRALAEAAEHGNERAMDRLLKQGVDSNAAGKFKVTPLWWAIRTRNKIGFAYLLAHGAQPNPPVETITVMEMAAGYEDSGYLETALRYKPDLRRVGGRLRRTALETAIAFNHKHDVELLIKNGADLNLDDINQTPLESAVAAGDYEIVYMMLVAGADPTPTFASGVGPPAVRNRLAASIGVRIINPDEENYEWRERVIHLLKNKGIEVRKPTKERAPTKSLPPDLLGQTP